MRTSRENLEKPNPSRGNRLKQVLQNRSGLTVVREVPAPPCPPGSVLVRNAFSAISSGTERSRAELSQKSLLAKARERPDLVREVLQRVQREGLGPTRHAVKRKLDEETAVGYSSAGTVIEVGAAVRNLRVGDRVACAGGGHANHAEIVSVPANLVAKVPHGVSLEAAALTTIAAIPLHGIRLSGVTVGDSVAVIGCGLVGQIACRLLRTSGARVFALDIDQMRVEQARSYAEDAFVSSPGVSEAVRAATGGAGVDHVLLTAAAPSNDPLLLATEMARDRASIVLVGVVPIDIPRAAMYDKELSFRVSRSYGPGRYDLDYEERGLDYPIGYVRWTEQRNMECVLDLQASGRLDLHDLIEVVPVERAAEAYGRLVAAPSERPQGALVLEYGDPGEPRVPQPTNRRVHLETPEHQATVQRTAAPVRVGLIGPGSFAARVLVPALVEGGARLIAVAGGSGPSAEVASRTLGFERVAETESDLIGDDSVDAVVVATRHGSHADLVRQALQAGKHVFCEKPLALTLEELDSVLRAAAESTGVLAVGFNRRFAPLLHELRAFVVSPPSPVAATYRVSAGRLPTDHWTHDLEQGGGRLIGECCHFVDSLVFVTGSEIEEVHATGYGDSRLPLQARDNVAVTLNFANGSVGSILYVADGSSRVSKERLEAFSGSRSAVLDDYRALELFGTDGKESRGNRGQDKGHRLEIDAFLRSAEQGQAPVPLEELANVSLATLAAVESLKTGQTIRLTGPRSGPTMSQAPLRSGP
jgi:predicted dehydrogenase/threonine dehydrogenase-like Zn-dependent dehydrogenase